MRKIKWQWLAVPALMAVVGCGDGTKAAYDAKPGMVDAAPSIDAAPPTPDAACFTNPTTHYEIINGCTTAQSVDKSPDLPGLLSDGGLPPLP